MKKWLLFIFVLLQAMHSNATHLVGGDMTYTCLGDNIYEIKLIIFRDCSQVVPFDNNAPIAIYNAGFFKETLIVPLKQTYPNVPITVDTCSPPPPQHCVEYGEYIDTVYLEPIFGGYDLAHQRCCRNSGIVNIINPQTTGNTWATSIPSLDTTCNSSPRFTTFPSLLICHQQAMTIPNPVTDPDGDSLVFSLCDPYLGAGRQQNSGPNGVIPNPPTPPPYAAPAYPPPYSSTEPITGNPSLSIDSKNGDLTVIADPIGGIFTVSVCVEEYRDGVLLSKVNREMQFVVGNCVLTTEAGIRSQADVQGSSSICAGLTIDFRHFSSGMQTAFWKFNDPGHAPHDTSHLENPTYTFSDTGTYEVMLIINTGMGECEDTAFGLFEVRNPIDNYFTYSHDSCYGSEVIFSLEGTNLSNNAEIEWEFGPNASPSTYSGSNPPPIQFTDAGHTSMVTLNTSDYECTSSYTKEIILFPIPEFSVTENFEDVCLPLEVELNLFAEVTGNYRVIWDMDDGTEYRHPHNISHTYNDAGTYHPSVTAFSTDFCIDTLHVEFGPVHVYPLPEGNMMVHADEISYYMPEAIFSFSVSDDVIFSYFDAGDGAFYDSPDQIRHEYSDTGVYDTYFITENSFGCTDTAHREIRVVPLTNIFIPNTFTPNGDGVNDLFIIGLTGIQEFELWIYNRWGQQVFYSDKLDHFWDGSINGRMSPTGVYQYIFKAEDWDGVKHSRTGTLRLIR